MSKATEDKLGDLHGALAREFSRQIQDGDAAPALLNAARQFLKDNGIEADGAKNSQLGNLAAELEQLDDVLPANVHPIKSI